MIKHLFCAIALFSITACSSSISDFIDTLDPIEGGNGEEGSEEEEENNGGSENEAFSYSAAPVYNNAYIENFEDADQLVDIIANAENAYVLLDPDTYGAADAIVSLHANGNEVGAYISIGTGENYRSDFAALEPFLVDTAWDQWDNEYFVNTVTTGIVPIMKARIDNLADMGFDWVEFDNMDWGYDNNYRQQYGFVVTEAEAIAYYQDLCSHVKLNGMKCMAKNLTVNASAFDGVIYESFEETKNWWDTAGTQGFLDAGKLVIINHYGDTDCAPTYSEYINYYNADLSFICEDISLGKYVHFNQ